MNRKEASVKWEVSYYQVGKICKHMKLDTNNIPEGIRPVYIPDKRYTKDPHRYYIFVLDVIANTHYELENIDSDIIDTCVKRLFEANLIILKEGKSNSSLDYHDYMISSNREIFYNWKYCKMKSKLELIMPIIENVK